MKALKIMLLGMLTAQFSAAGQRTTGTVTTISGSVERGVEETEKFKDSVYLRIAYNKVLPELSGPVYSAPIINGKFTFKVPSEKGLIVYDLSHDRKAPSDYDGYVIRSGDDLKVEIKKNTTVFSGAGKLLAGLCYDSDRQISSEEFNAMLQQVPDKNQFEKQLAYFEVAEIKRSRLLLLLEAQKAHLRPDEYHLIYARIIGVTGYAAMRGFIVSADPSKFSRPQADSLMRVIDKDLTFGDRHLHGDQYVRSMPYLEYVSYRYSVENKLTGINVKHFERYKTTFTGRLRELLIAQNFRLSYKTFDNPDSILAEVKKLVKDPEILKILERKNAGIKIGKQAPDFTLPGADGRQYNLKDFRGKTVVMDFWYTGCAGCTSQYQNVVSKVEKEYSGNDEVVFLTISIDGNKDEWINSINEGLYTSKHAVNLYTNGARSKHPVINTYGVTGYPTSFIIDSEGKIAAVSGSFITVKALTASINRIANK